MAYREEQRAQAPNPIYQPRRELPWRMRLGVAIGLLALALVSSSPISADSAVTEYRTTLLELIDTMGEILYSIDPGSAEEFSDAVVYFDEVTDEELETVYMENLPLEDLHQQIEDLEPYLSLVGGSYATGGSRQISIPELEVPLPGCVDISPEITLATSVVARVAEAIIAALQFVCFQQNAGNSAALACTAPEIIRSVASNLHSENLFCLGIVQSATASASLELTQGIGNHLNNFVDDVKLSSRASQQALNATRADMNTALLSTQSIQAMLDSGDTQLDAQSAQLSQAVANLGSDLNQLSSILDDISFKSSVNLAELEDLAIRVADLQQRASAIQSDAEALVSGVGAVNSAGMDLKILLEADWNRQRLDLVAADLGNPGANNPANALPASAGGDLELVREIVISAILSLNALGTVDTSPALTQVGKADQLYNAGQYVMAYQTFKQAYQLLDGLSEGR